MTRMDRHAVAALMKRHRVSQTKIAHDLGVHVNSVHAVIHGRMKSRRIAEHIARLLSTSVERLWPDAYECGHAQDRRAA